MTARRQHGYWLALLALGGCETPPPQKPEVVAASAPSARAVASAAPSAEPAPSASAEPVAAPGFRRWTNYAGPKGSFATGGEQLFVVRPSGVEWDKGLTMTLARFVRSEGDDHVVTTVLFASGSFPSEPELYVPAAMTCAPTPEAKFTKGDIVMFEAAATTHDFGRVTAVETDGEDVTLQVGSRWVSRQDRPYSPKEVLRLEDKLTCGQRVMFDNAAKDERRWATLVRVVGDRAWVLGFPEGEYSERLLSLPANDVTPMPLRPLHAVGADVLVATGNHTLVPAKVLAVLDDGLAYTIRSDANEWDADFEEVTAAKR